MDKVWKMNDVILTVGLIIEAAGGKVTVPPRLLEENFKDINLVVERTENYDGSVTFETHRKPV
jgi:hypothetical protein